MLGSCIPYNCVHPVGGGGSEGIPGGGNHLKIPIQKNKLTSVGSSVFQVTSVSLEVVVCSVFAGFFPLPPFPGQESRKLQVTLSTPRGWACGQIAYAICQEGKAQTRSPQGSSSPSHGWLLPVPILLNLHSKGLVPCPRKEAPHSCRTTASGCSRGPASSKMGSTGACGKILCPTPKLGF